MPTFEYVGTKPWKLDETGIVWYHFGVTDNISDKINKRSTISRDFPLFRHAISPAACDKERVYRTLFVERGNVASRWPAMESRGQQEGNKVVESRLKSMTPYDGLKGSMFTLNHLYIILYVFISIYYVGNICLQLA